MNKNIVALGFVSFFTDMASSMVTPLIPILVVYILNNDVQTLSEIVAITTFASYAFRILFGYLGDKYQLTKPLVVTGYLISAVTKPLFHYASSWQSVAILQTTERMGKAIRSAGKDSLISTFAGTNQSGKAFGFHKMMDIGGELAGAIIVFLTLSWLGQEEDIIRGIFAITIIPGLFAVIIVSFFVKDGTLKNKSSRYQWQKSDTKLLPLMFFYFLYLVFIFNGSFFVIKASDLGYQIAIIPLFFIVLNITQTVTSYHIGLKIDKVGAANVLLTAFAFGILTQLCLYFDFIWLAFVFLGLFTVTSLNAVRSYISHHASNTSTVFGIFYGGTALFSALGALLIGYVWENWSVSLAMEISIFGSILITLLFALARRRYVELD